MTRRKPFLLLGALMNGALAQVAASALTQSRDGKLPKVPVGAVAAQVTGRLAGGGGLNGEYELLCYLTFLEGLGTSVFAGDPVERNAQFTLRSDRFRFQTTLNGSLVHFGRLATPGTEPPRIRVYYLDSPHREFSRPGEFLGWLAHWRPSDQRDPGESDTLDHVSGGGFGCCRKQLGF